MEATHLPLRAGFKRVRTARAGDFPTRLRFRGVFLFYLIKSGAEQMLRPALSALCNQQQPLLLQPQPLLQPQLLLQPQPHPQLLPPQPPPQQQQMTMMMIRIQRQPPPPQPPPNPQPLLHPIMKYLLN